MDRLAELTQGIAASNLLRCHDCGAACWEKAVWLYWSERDAHLPPTVMAVCEACEPRRPDAHRS